MDFDLTRFFVTILALNPCARMAPTARLGYNGARAKLAGQINVRLTLRARIKTALQAYDVTPNDSVFLIPRLLSS